MTVTMTNPKAVAATGLTYTVNNTSGTTGAGWYSRNGGTCGATLAASSSCTVVIARQAGCTGGSRGGSLVVDGTNTAKLTVGLSGSTSTSGLCQ